MEEKWKAIEGFEGLYEVSNLGRVKSLERLVENNGGFQRRHERILRQNAGPHKHCCVVLCKDGKTFPKLVHRLVAIAFIPNPDDKPVVDHIDANPFNNRVENLRWATTQENCLNPITRKNNSKSKMGHPAYGRPLTQEEREKIRHANLGRKLTDAHKKALSEAHKNSKRAVEASKQNIKKAIQSNAGKQLSDATKEKIRDRLTGVHRGKHWKVVDGKRVWYTEVP